MCVNLCTYKYSIPFFPPLYTSTPKQQNVWLYTYIYSQTKNKNNGRNNPINRWSFSDTRRFLFSLDLYSRTRTENLSSPRERRAAYSTHTRLCVILPTFQLLSRASSLPLSATAHFPLSQAPRLPFSSSRTRDTHIIDIWRSRGARRCMREGIYRLYSSGQSLNLRIIRGS